MSHINSSGSGSIIPGTVVLNVTTVVFAQSPYTVLPTDEFIGVSTAGGPITILLPNAPLVGRTYIVKDIDGFASTDNITVTTVGGVDLIDSATSVIMNTDFESNSFIYGGSSNYYIY